MCPEAERLNQKYLWRYKKYLSIKCSPECSLVLLLGVEDPEVDGDAAALQVGEEDGGHEEPVGQPDQQRRQLSHLHVSITCNLVIICMVKLSFIEEITTHEI